MRVGVEEAVDEHLLEVGAEQLVGEAGAVQVGPAERAEESMLRPSTKSIVSTREVV